MSYKNSAVLEALRRSNFIWMECICSFCDGCGKPCEGMYWIRFPEPVKLPGAYNLPHVASVYWHVGPCCKGPVRELWEQHQTFWLLEQAT